MTDFKPFRDKLHDHTLPVPDELWDRIEANLPESRRRRIAPWFWLTLLSGILLGGLIVYSALQLAPSPSGPERDESRPQAQEDQAIAPAPPSTQGQFLAEGSVFSPDTRTMETPAVTTASLPSSKALVRNPLEGRSAQRNSRKPKVIPTESYLVSATKADEPSLQRPGSHLTGTADPDLISLPSESEAIALAAESLALELKGISCPAPVIPRMRKPRFKTDIHCYKFSKNTGNLVWSADLYGGPGLSPRSLTDTGSESSVYTHARKATESNAYTWHAGGRVNLQLRSGLTFAAGIEYAQAGDVFDYTDTLATQSTTRIDSFFAADGTFLYADTNRVLILGTLIKRVHNTYRYLDIPLLAGIEIPLKRSMLMVHAGPVFNVVSRQEGEILDPALHPRTIDSGRADRLPAYRSSLGLSLYISGGLLLPLTQNLSALIEPRLLYRINPVTLDGYPLAEKRYHAGLSLGLRYHFLKS